MRIRQSLSPHVEPLSPISTAEVSAGRNRAATGDRLARALAAVSAGSWFDFFLAEPYLRSTIADADDIEVTVLLEVTGVASASSRCGATGNRGKLPDAPDISTESSPPRALSPKEACPQPLWSTLWHVLTRDARAVDVERSGLPADEYVAVPVQRGPQIVGHFLLAATSHVVYPTGEQRRVAVLLADQVAAAQ